jgi:cytochrome c553
MKNLIGLLVFTFVIVGSQDALALTQFKKPFAEKYAKNHKSKEFQDAVKKATCNACHVKGVNKKIRNEYGKVLSKLIEGNAKEYLAAEKAKGKKEEVASKKKILELFDKALDKAAEMKSAGGKGPKYGDLLKEGKLPVDLAKVDIAKAKKEYAELKAKEAKAKEAKAKAETVEVKDADK